LFSTLATTRHPTLEAVPLLIKTGLRVLARDSHAWPWVSIFFEKPVPPLDTEKAMSLYSVIILR
jgi:hypothetical protein